MNRIAVRVAVVLLACTSVTFSRADSTWVKWQWIVGEWVGEGSGTPGDATGGFSVQPDLDGKVLIRKNHASFPAANGRPALKHDDLMVMYHDGTGGPDRAIYFDNEGHVINYAIAFSDMSIVLTSDAIKDTPVFRLTYVALGQDSVDVTFAMSQDGKTFRTYTRGKCRRVK
jgi:hypothetical protein